MPTYSATGITLSTHKYGDTGRVVTFFTLECGKVEASATGIGKPGSKLAAAVEPMTLSKLFFTEGRGMDRLSQAEVIESHYNLRNDLIGLAHASYMLELTEALTEPGQPLPEVFEDLRAALAALVGGAEAALVATAYTMRLLASQGMAPELEVCLECGARLEGQAGYAPSSGGFVCRKCSPESGGRMQVSGAALGFLRGLLTVPFNRLGRVSVRLETRREVEQVVLLHSDYHVGEQLKSRKFLDKLRR
ncbi:MAG: DNA repair protein RecO [Armatimonadia bacterium]